MGNLDGISTFSVDWHFQVLSALPFPNCLAYGTFNSRLTRDLGGRTLRIYELNSLGIKLGLEHVYKAICWFLLCTLKQDVILFGKNKRYDNSLTVYLADISHWMHCFPDILAHIEVLNCFFLGYQLQTLIVCALGEICRKWHFSAWFCFHWFPVFQLRVWRIALRNFWMCVECLPVCSLNRTEGLGYFLPCLSLKNTFLCQTNVPNW